ncbi:DUF1651 domain-containing protein [Cyanobium sp. T1B-Tous]|uniref:DUF1651 domain-containing protein n=1 Tax=Cyanobium sp. T1B-Tous TaxID=2823721 RepID=UPI0037C04C41
MLGEGRHTCRGSPPARLSRRVTRRTPASAAWRNRAARNWGPSNHQWPNSSASKGATSRGRRSIERARPASSLARPSR